MTFSRGLRQKAAIALAFIRPFEILLVDEPFVGLDRTGRDALLELFRRVHDDGAALVVATHELTTVERRPAPRRPARRRARLRRAAGGRRRRRPRRPLTGRPAPAATTVRPRARLDTVPAMYEFDSVSVSTYEAASLAAKLTEKSADGWEVVAIVPAGSDITAFLKRAASDDGAARDADDRDGLVGRGRAGGRRRPGADRGQRAVGLGHGAGRRGRRRLVVGPDRQRADSGSWGSGASRRPAESGLGRRHGDAGDASRRPGQPATPSVPAGWYADPAGRYELRYWDGSAWTEHVSRNGQQYTDPPVA